MERGNGAEDEGKGIKMNPFVILSDSEASNALCTTSQILRSRSG
jgi:hypothetical protein